MLRVCVSVTITCLLRTVPSPSGGGLGWGVPIVHLLTISGKTVAMSVRVFNRFGSLSKSGFQAHPPFLSNKGYAPTLTLPRREREPIKHPLRNMSSWNCFVGNIPALLIPAIPGEARIHTEARERPHPNPPPEGEGTIGRAAVTPAVWGRRTCPPRPPTGRGRDSRGRR